MLLREYPGSQDTVRYSDVLVTLDLFGMGIVIGSCIQEEEPEYNYRLRRVVYGKTRIITPLSLGGSLPEYIPNIPKNIPPIRPPSMFNSETKIITNGFWKK